MPNKCGESSYASCNGPLYQVRRSSNNATPDIGVLSAGGYAKAPRRTIAGPPLPRRPERRLPTPYRAG
jgi:hypothetical protein